ncbi:hypothetical protein [Paraburkholderia phenoliruptrix]|uniref:hypothetical protein n=1 Tax=Paraburkholderia phenoliruptrix TaxID=252970 RepID=UPI002869A246|nr:hypothetical protein [Paraburkholderia phenoliruptrix]WMY11081.1 hypothetical protein P3F88_30965 [Paraburkholderia phenoliruptrix]
MKLIEQLWTFALHNPALLVVPAIGFVLSLVVVRIKTRYVNDGVLFERSSSARRERERACIADEEGDMPTVNELDLTIALAKIHELAVAEGDLGYEYWHGVGELLKRANSMQAQIDSLSKELERCRAMLPKAD